MKYIFSEHPERLFHANFFYGVIMSAMVLGVFHKPVDADAVRLLSGLERPDLREIVERFAPEVRLHPEERYFPASVSWFLERAASVGERMGETPGAGFYHIPNDERRAETRAGSLESAEAYVHIRPRSQGNREIDIQYWFFYPYNGPLIPGPAGGAHEGDWEHITVRIDRTWRQIRRVFYAAHDREGRWFRPRQISFSERTHPIVYSARYGHASYPSPGLKARGYLPADRTADGGAIWQTWHSLRVIAAPDLDPAQAELDWLDFKGRWGRRGTFFSGPPGPAFQRYWAAES